MRAAMLVLLGCAGSVVSADEANTSGGASELGVRILGGTQAEIGKWRWNVAIMDVTGRYEPRQQYCGGTVVAPQWVLTAAHCVDDGVAPEDIQVLVDTHDLEWGGRRIGVRAIHPHEGYATRSTENDIALLELSRPARVPAVGIPDRARSATVGAPGTIATVMGWGMLREASLGCEPGEHPRASGCTTHEGVAGHYVDAETGQPINVSDVLPSRLMQVDLPLVDEQTCRAAYPGEPINDRTLCAGYAQGGKDSCQADSGGPLVVRDGDTWVQAGVVSWGFGCGRPGRYGVYTNVAAFAPWIAARTGIVLASSGETPPAPETPAAQPLSDSSSQEDVAVQASEGEAALQPMSPPLVREKGRALLVGIDLYAEPRFQDLRGAVRDARNMRRLLVEHLGFRPDEIRMLLDRDATREAILGGIRHWLIDSTRPGDRALLYFAGHGYFQIDHDGDEADGYDEVLVPQDARLVSGEPQPMHIENLIRDDEVAALLDELHDRQAFLIVDSCHSGTMTRSAAAVAADQRYVRTLLSDDARDFGRRALETPFTSSMRAARQRDTGFIDSRGSLVAWTAVSPTQLALEDREADQPQGVFTRRFIQGVTGRADRDGDGRVVYTELFDYVRAESAAYCVRHPRHCENGLTPTLQANRDLLLAEVASGAPLDADAASTAGGALAHTNAAGVQLRIHPSTHLRFEEHVRYLVRSDRSGHLLLVDVDPGGKVTQMFPNPRSDQAGKGTAIEAGRTVEIPNAFYGFEIEVGPPAGQGVAIAIVTEDPVSLDDLLDRHRDFTPVEDARDWLLALGERLRKPWLEETGTREAKWSADMVRYEIRP